MAVPPVPVFFLLVWGQIAEIAIGIPVRFPGPLIVVSNFITVPIVIVAMISVVNAIMVTFTTAAGYRTT